MKLSRPSFVPFIALTALVSISSGLFAADGPEFFDDFEKARKASQETGKPMVTIFSASWCGPCKKMKKNVYPSTEVAPYHDRFIWAYLDADASKNRSLMKQFQVNGIPHISFVSAGGELIGQARGAVAPANFAETLSSTLVKAGDTAPVAPVAPGAEPEKKKGLFGIFKKKA
ncbi:MAG: thioredoxin family protein [Verrucomicrobiales bacterium]|nr:thioredoxin family protein [Verrucomicrobiales bacterium]